MMRAIANSGQEKNLKVYRDRSNWNPYRIQGGPVLYPSAETYRQFADLYDIDMQTIVELEDAIEMTVSLDSFPAVWDNTIITRGLETEFNKPSQPNDSMGS